MYDARLSSLRNCRKSNRRNFRTTMVHYAHMGLCLFQRALVGGCRLISLLPCNQVLLVICVILPRLRMLPTLICIDFRIEILPNTRRVLRIFIRGKEQVQLLTKRGMKCDRFNTNFSLSFSTPLSFNKVNNMDLGLYQKIVSSSRSMDTFLCYNVRVFFDVNGHSFKHCLLHEQILRIVKSRNFPVFEISASF